MNSDGSAKIPIFQGARISQTASFSPDSKKVAFESLVTGSGAAIRTMNPDSSGLSGSLEIGSDPHWSPDGLKIVAHFGGQLFTINSDGSDRRVITTGGSGFFPVWSPDGSKIVFNTTISTGIHSVSPNGGPLTQLANTGSYPAFSPNGAKISFIRNGDIYTMNSDGSGAVMIYDANLSRTRPVWAPDGNSIFFVEGGFFKRINPDGTGLTPVAFNWFFEDFPFWGGNDVTATNTGSNIPVNAGNLSITFSSVTSAGETTVTPIPPNSAGSVPGGFVIGGVAYEISTTAGITPPISVCFKIPTTVAPTQFAFNQLAIMHNEGGTLVNRTVSRDFSTRTICASVNSLSPFAIAHEIDNAMPSISGVVVDTNGNPLSGVQMKLTGTEERTGETDSDGVFSFVNLTANGNYNVEPKHPGYLFSDYNRDFINLTGEQTVAFIGDNMPFGISGRVLDGMGNPVAGVAIGIEGVPLEPVTTDADGNYAFADLPADGTFIITPLQNGSSFTLVQGFSPAQMVVTPLTGNASGVDFTRFAPTAATVSVGGRVLTAGGQGIYRVLISMTDDTGSTQTALTNPFGFYRFDGVSAGRNYVFVLNGKQFGREIPPVIRFISDEVTDLNFTVPTCPKNDCMTYDED